MGERPVFVGVSVCLLLAASSAWAAMPGQSRLRRPFLESVGVSVEIDGRLARTELALVYRNPNPVPAEATARLRVPRGAVPSGLAMEVEGVMTEGRVFSLSVARASYASLTRDTPQGLVWSDDLEELMRRDRAVPRLTPEPLPDSPRSAFDWTREEWVPPPIAPPDPALLEWSGPGRLALRFFPIMARSSKAIALHYDELLPVVEDGLVEYRWRPPKTERAADGVELRFELTTRGAEVVTVDGAPAQIRQLDEGRYEVTLGAPLPERRALRVLMRKQPPGSLRVRYSDRSDGRAFLVDWIPDSDGLAALESGSGRPPRVEVLSGEVNALERVAKHGTVAVMGRLKSDSATLRLTARVRGREVEREVELTPPVPADLTDSGAVVRSLWAAKHANRKNRLVVAMSEQVMVPKTGFLVVEDGAYRPSALLGARRLRFVGAKRRQAEVENRVRRTMGRIRFCYAEAYDRREHRLPYRKVPVSLLIFPDGRVRGASVGGDLPTSLKGCIARRLRAMRLSRHKEGGVTRVSYPLVLQLRPPA